MSARPGPDDLRSSAPPHASGSAWQTATQRLAQVAFFAAIPLLLFLVATLMAGHWYTLPQPETSEPGFQQRLAALRGEDEPAGWLGIHVLYADCGCSRRVLQHLFESERPEGLSEHILLVGRHPEFENQARLAHIPLTVLRPQELKEKFAIESAPLFLVLSPADEVRYSGGYTERKRGLSIRDREIASSLMQEQGVESLPLFGCAVSQRLQQMLDPLGIKYSRGPKTDEDGMVGANQSD